MALIKCKECGKEFSDQAAACPNCGYPNTPAPIEIEPKAADNILNTRYRNPDMKKNSGLSIAALILSIMGCTFVLGIILAIIDLIRRDNTKKHTLSKISIFISVLWLLITLAFGTAEPKDTDIDVSVSTPIEESEALNTEESVGTEGMLDTTQYETESESETETELETPAESKEDFIASCQEIPYKKLLRNPDDYIGQRIVITAKVQQIMQGGWLDDNQYYRVYTDNDGYELYYDDEYFMYDFRVDDSTKLLADDVLKIYAEFAGLETVTRALTSTKEDIPAIKAYYVEIIAE